MPVTNKRKRSSNGPTPEVAEEPATRMVLRSRKVRILSPPTRTKSSKTRFAEVPEDSEPPVVEKSPTFSTNTSPKTPSEPFQSLEKGKENDIVNGEVAEAPTSNPRADQSESESDSDAAPEAVSLAASQAQSLKRSADQVRAIRAQEYVAKQKRRDRDTRLKSQAGERARKKKEESVQGREILGSLEIESKDETDANNELDPSTAEFLPQHILDELPTRRSPTPPSTSKQQQSTLSKSQVLVQKHTKHGVTKLPLPSPPKDLSLDARTTISVLHNQSKKHLAPMVQNQGKVSRDNWLLGRTTLANLGGPKKVVLGKKEPGSKDRRLKPNFRMERRAWGAGAKFV